MAPKAQLSITLPRNLSFHYDEDDHELPRTPAPPLEVDISEPPPPPRQTFKVRRRRPAEKAGAGLYPRLDAEEERESTPLPTIEMSEALRVNTSPPTAMSPGYLAPLPSFLPMLSPPKTPVSQTHTYDVHDHSHEWSLISGHSLTRPLSACSSFSNSSASSIGSNNSYSLGGSCTSPESDIADPFAFSAPKERDGMIISPRPSSNSPLPKRHKTNRHAGWTPEMDRHLWLAYIIYIQDPRVTPFKMLPGTAPPLGVCHRVAREAKRTWKGQASSPNTHGRNLAPSIEVGRTESPSTVRQSTRTVGGTPLIADHSRGIARWPRSEAATRKHLRQLCKRNPSLPIHYQRLLQTRSPSPFQSSSPQSRSDPQSDAFSSRGMNISLAAATAPSMQIDGPLAQLASHLSDVPEVSEALEVADMPEVLPKVPAAPKAPAVQKPEEWFARIGRAGAHQKTRSLQLGLGLDRTWGPSATSTFASPFVRPHERAGSMEHNIDATRSLGRNFGQRPDGTAAPLRSPFEVHAPVPISRSLKRRFRIDEDGPSKSTPLHDLFTAPLQPSIRPARERAFSLSAMGDGTRSLGSFFSPPSDTDLVMTEADNSKHNTYNLAPPETVRRLGSPFGGAAASSHFNTFPRRFTPLGSEIPNQSMHDRLRQLATQR